MEYRKLRTTLMMLISVLLFGTISYHNIEGMPLFESFYMTMITISTVGFSEIKPLSPYGRIVTMIIISTGITIGAYTIGMILQLVVEGEFKKSYWRRKMEKKISRLKGHFIICGFGRIGALICSELKANDIDFVVIEKDPKVIAVLENDDFLYLPMDSTSEETLLKAGIMNARGIVTAVTHDADNVFIILTAKGLRPDIFVLSRSSDVKNETKLFRAGANRVVSPYLIGGKRMAQMLIKPTVIDFIDIAMMSNRLDLVMEEAQIGPGSSLVGKNLIQSNLRQDYGVIIVAIKKKAGEMIFNPMPQEKLEAEDILVVLGKSEIMDKMSQVL
ncbi:TrkA-N domain protein [uncultured Desulfobacterium sp.]|uniref:TrkA-N domain protein n=1 Tax=uncultured Desulfobacterium sp. TaxID=201089 RepID=A0A445MRS2_9BACT|nr:TrkA-N domain protein [uncultured Desulfobacterium sp.]